MVSLDWFVEDILADIGELVPDLLIRPLFFPLCATVATLHNDSNGNVHFVYYQ